MQADGVRGPVGIRLGHVGRGEDPAGGAEAQPGPEVRDLGERDFRSGAKGLFPFPGIRFSFPFSPFRPFSGHFPFSSRKTVFAKRFFQ